MTHIACPACGGTHLPAHPAGLITFRHTTGCAIQHADDQRLVSDFTDAVKHREATETERFLLAHLGYEIPTRLDTEIGVIAGVIVHRSWPDLTPP